MFNTQQSELSSFHEGTDKSSVQFKSFSRLQTVTFTILMVIQDFQIDGYELTVRHEIPLIKSLMVQSNRAHNFLVKLAPYSKD